ncbi:MAG: hypothetical protein KBA86_04970 [Bacteroidales bacterium]|nr:hypothetical protein [Bacteroidales bacterium]
MKKNEFSIEKADNFLRNDRYLIINNYVSPASRIVCKSKQKAILSFIT